jgi:tetratricopeptide (TPR) repeat protein
MTKNIKRTTFLLVTIWLCRISVFGQDYAADKTIIDSLKNELTKVNIHDTIYINLLSEIGEQTPIFRSSYWDTIANLATKKLSTHPPAPVTHALRKALASVLNNIGVIHNAQGDIPLALEYYHKSLKIQEEIGDKKGMATSYNNIGLIHNNQGGIPLALEYYHKSLEIYEEIGDKRGMAISYNNIGLIHDNQGDIPLALEYHHKSLKIQEEIGNKNGIALSYNNIGYIHNAQGDIPLALEYYHKSLKIQEEIGNKKGIALSYNNIGLIHHNQGDIPLALEYYHESLKIQEEIGDKKGMATSYNNIGLIHHNQGDPSITSSKEESLRAGQALALEYYHKSLEIYEEIGDKRGMAYSYNNIGYIHDNQGDIPLALEYYHKSLKIQEEIGDKRGMAYSLANICNLYLSRGSELGLSTRAALALARENGERGLQIAQELGFPDQIKRNAGVLSKVAIAEGNYKEALEMRNLEVQMQDSLMSEEAQKAAVQQQVKYEYEKAQAVKQKEYEKQMALSGAREEKQKIIIYTAAGASLMLIAFLVFVFNRLKVTRKQKSIIESTHQQLAEHHKEIQDSIKYAKRIQEAILPSMSAMSDALKDSFVLYKPKDVVAGDFFWMERVAPAGNKSEGAVYFAAADCTGHGVPGAMVSVVCSNALSKALLEEGIAETGKLLDRTREIVIHRLAKSGEEVKDGMDISLCMVDFDRMTLQWSGANNPLWLIRNGELTETKPDKQPIGVHDNITPFTTHNFELQKDDTVYIFTDGFQDQFGGEKQKKYMTKQLKNLMLGLTHENMDNQKTILDKEFENWRGQIEQVDDVCVIGVRL